MMVYITHMKISYPKTLNLCNQTISGLFPKVYEKRYCSPYVNYFSSCLSTTGNTNRHTPYITKVFYTTNNMRRSNLVDGSSFKIKSLWDDEKTRDEPSAKESSMSISNFRFTADKQANFFISKLQSEANRANKLKSEDWDALISSVLGMAGIINKENIDAIIMKECIEMPSLTLGKSYFKYLKSGSKKINRATYGNYLLLFYKCSSECTENDLNEINIVYRELLEVYQELDSYTAEKAVCALSITEHWKEYEKLFKHIEKFCHPSSYVYSAVIKTAFKNNDINLGWDLMEQMQLQGQYVPDDVFLFWLQMVRNKKRDNDLKKMLEFLCNFNFKPSLTLCEAIKQTFEELTPNRRGTFTGVTRRGECTSCRGKLQSALVSQEDYDELKTTFLNPVLIGKDIFLKTRPEEFQKFLTFIEKTAPYDVVLDGLNIALKAHKDHRTPHTFVFQLNSVVRHFVSKRKKVLVLGRKHMAKWPQQDMKYIYDNAEVFLAEDISQDDPFLLYATLYSGLGTQFVSRDMMRGHKSLLANPKIQATFQKWQTQHQYFLQYIEDNGTVHLLDPIPFMQSIQQNSQGDWHIPYLIKEHLNIKSHVDNFHKHWLCLVNQRDTQTAGRFEKKMENGHHNKRKVGEERPVNQKNTKHKFVNHVLCF